MQSQGIEALAWEDRYYSVALRVGAVAALIVCLAAFLFLPREFVVKPYQMRRSIEMVMEALPPQLEKMAEEPKVEKPQSVPVAAESDAEVEAQTIDATTFQEVIKRTTDTDIPIVPFWKVEVKPKPVKIPVPNYPEMARTAGIEGQAVVEALVDVDGTVADARILKSAGNTALDQAAVEAAMRSTFTPAKQRDQAVRVWVSIPFRFTLTSQ
ncbi:MAG: energy transducer TonB [bacterium]